jgi:hypothetical protein
VSRTFDARITARMRAGGMRGLEKAARAILEESQKIVPVETGTLKRSGFVEVQGDRVAVGYTDRKATAAHENMKVRYDNGKRAKFLEEPLNASSSLVAGSVAKEIKVETS